MLKANVRVVAFVEGKRVEFNPGEEVKGLHPHDVKELLANGALEDTDATKRQEKKDSAQEAAASREFEDARERMTAAQESTQAAEPAKADGKSKK